MKIQVILEILVVLAVIAFASSRVIDSRDDISDFTGRLIKNVTKNPKDRQNEIVVGGDYEDDLNSNVSGEISVGEDDLINSQQISSSNDVNTAISGEENNILNSVPEVTDLPVNIDDAHPLNRYCTCNEIECNCCREFKLPLVSVRGPGCATVRYLGKNKMSVSIKYGDITLTSRTISGRKARPICLNLPGGYSQFCGRVYGINRDDEDFKACLGLELRAEDEVEAALRVSCFQFGPRGLKMTDPEPLPPVVDAADEDDEGGSDILSLIAGDDDDDSEDDDDDDLDDDDDDGGLPAASDDYPSGFSLLDGLFDTDSGNKKKKVTQNRNKVPSGNSEEDIKANNVGTKVKIPNSPAILSSAAISQNEIDSTLTKDQIADEVKIEKPVVVVKPVEPVKGVEEIKPATPAIEVPTTPKPKKKQTSLLDTLESLIGGDDDDDDDDDDEDAKDEAEEEQEDDEDDEEDAKDDEEEEEEDEEDAKEEEEEEDDDEEEENDDEDDESVAALDKITNDKEELADTDKIKKTKKKTDFGFGLLNFARLLKLI